MILTVIVLCVLAYWAGYSDGKLAESEHREWQRMDRAIAAVRPAKGER